MKFTARFLQTAYGGTINFATDPQWHDVFYGRPTPERIKELGRFLRTDPNRFVRLYHGTDASLPVLEKGLLPTSTTRRRSLQSGNGYVYLSVFPGSAEDFGRMGNPGKKIRVYGVEVTIRRLCADTDQLNNRRGVGDDVGNSLAESLVFGHGARVKGKIDPMQVYIFKDAGEMQFKAKFLRKAALPKVLYHGTSVSAWDTPETGNSTLYLTSSRDNAAGYAQEAVRNSSFEEDDIPLVLEISFSELRKPGYELDADWNAWSDPRDPEPNSWEDTLSTYGTLTVSGNIEALKPKFREVWKGDR
jgi:hypothetical protein